MLVQFLALPILLASEINLYVASFIPALTIATYLAMGPGAYLVIIQQLYNSSWKSKAKVLPALLIYSAGMSVNNSIAVFDAVFGKKNEFLRTPKYGIVKNTDDWKNKAYNLPFTKTTLLEIFFGIYGIMGILIAIFSSNPVFAPIIGIQTVGFFYIAYLSLSHTRFKRNKSRDNHIKTKGERMANTVYKLSIVGMVAIMIFGAFMAFKGYNDDIYPLDRIRGHIDGIMTASDPAIVKAHLLTIKQDLDIVMEKLPENKNPVWIFPTDSTNFARIEGDVNTMLNRIDELAGLPRDSSAFNTGMFDINSRALILRENIIDATPYMYVSVSNIVFSSIWIAAILGIFAALKRKKDQLKAYDEADGV
jgi:hypothetical protein